MDIRKVEPTTIVIFVFVVVFAMAFSYRYDMKDEITRYESYLTFEGAEIESIESVIGSSTERTVLFNYNGNKYKTIEYFRNVETLKPGDKATFTVKAKNLLNKSDQKEYSKLIEYNRKSDLASFSFFASFIIIVIAYIVCIFRYNDNYITTYDNEEFSYSLYNVYGVFLFFALFAIVFYYAVYL